ncbi:MAG: TonB-dependent receptor [Chitinophagaceae bacterium]|nr:TonB-dependent receptor [Chitinophagaceae bacterium]
MKKNFHLPKTIISLFILVISFSFAQAQTGTIKGTIRDERGPLAGASVTVGNKGTTTNENGEYNLKVAPGKHNVAITYAGYKLYSTSVTVGANESATADATLSSTVTGEEIVLVGSRSAGRSKLATPVPVDVIPVAQIINQLGQVDLNQILNFIAPSFQSSRQTVSDGTDHLDPAQLRGLGTDQVLVLINGKRRHQSALVNVNGTINRGQVSTDLSTIPATAIERIEILRDGAAAQYGSDAIAGVINIVLKKSTNILEASISYGAYVTKYPKNYALYKIQGKSDDPNVKITDGNTVQASLGYGFNLGKGYLNLTGEYIDRKGTNRTGTYTGGVAGQSNPIYPLVNGQVRDDSILSARGLTRNAVDMRVGNSDMKGGAVFYNFAYPVSTNGEIYAFGGYSNKKGNATGVYRYPSGYANVGNAAKFQPQALALYPNGFLPQILTDISDFSTAVGFRTKFNQWNFDISNTYGSNKFDFGVANSVNYSQFAVNPNPQTSFDPGGLKFSQNTVNADFSRKYAVMAGLNVATGLEYRSETFGIRTGEESSYKNYDAAPSNVSPGAQVFPGFTDGGDHSRNSHAIYVDLEQDFSSQFLLTGALRYEHYSDFGSTFNYKFSTRYKFSDNFSVRASVSSGFRAPSLQQRFYTKTNTLFVGTPLAPIQAATLTNESRAAALLGIPKLKEETSQNYSIGFTAKPFKGFELTVDAYEVDIKNRIILTNNFDGNSNVQIKAILDAAGAQRANFFTNGVDTRAKGLEAVLSYNKSFKGKQSLRTTLAMSFIDNEVKKDANGKPIVHASDLLVSGGQLNNYFNREDQSRFETANPKSKISLTFNYKISKFGVLVRFVRFGEVKYFDGTNFFAPTTATNAFTGVAEITDQTFKPKVVTDLSLSYDITKFITATAGANNIFDVYQDIQTHSSNQSSGRFIYSRRVEQMGYNGAYYFVRLKLTLDTKK